MRMRKRAFALLAVFALAVGLCVPAFADAARTYSITIDNSKSGHVYEAYQVFTGDLSSASEDDGVSGTTAILSNVKWGKNVSEAGREYFGDASEKAELLKTAEDADDFAAELWSYLGDKPAVSSFADGKYLIPGLEAGYYLIVDKDSSLNGKDDSYTEYIVEVIENSTVRPKSDLPTVEKKVKDTNDSVANSTTEWQDSADHDFGDAVPFKLTATLANNVSAYESYKVVFHDTLSAGLTYNGDAKIWLLDAGNGDGDEDVTKWFAISSSPSEGGGTALEFSCNNVKVFGATDDSVVVVEYTARLNENSVLGSKGNPNVVYLEYSNNPNWVRGDSESLEDSPTGETSEDEVIVFTYQVVVNKVDEKGEPLAGAGFTLYKKNHSGEYEAVGSELKGNGMTTFTWSRIDDGCYKIVETTTPAGYNTISDVEFVVSAEHQVEADDPKLVSLSGEAASGLVFSSLPDVGSLTSKVENKAGLKLPETGGIGTTLFYVVGGALVIGAAVLLVVRRRAAGSEE